MDAAKPYRAASTAVEQVPRNVRRSIIIMPEV
jgi:hypothetical protein